MQKTKRHLALIAALCLTSTAVMAQKSSTQEIQDHSERAAVLESQLKALEVEIKVLKAQNDILQSQAATRRSVNVDAENDMGTPTVAYVEGVKGNLEAVLVYRGNIRQRARVGDAIFGSVVKRITLNEVVLGNPKNNRETRLQFSAGAVTRDAAMNPSANGPIPTVPLGMPGQPLPSPMR